MDLKGYASAVAVEPSHVTLPEAKVKVPKLSEALIRRASLKMNRWKELREVKRAGGFGSVLKGGELLFAMIFEASEISQFRLLLSPAPASRPPSRRRMIPQ